MSTEGKIDSSFVRVLLCDDQAIVGEAIRQSIATLPGAEFRFVSDPNQLLEQLTSFKPTVLLQDLVLPNISGITIVKDLRAREAFRDLPIILLSTTEDSKTKYEAFEAGASDYVVKFPETFELIGRVRYHSRAYINLQEREAAQKLLAQRGRLESLGTLAAGIAHEINTPLQYISSNLSYLSEALSTEPSAITDIVEMRSALKDSIDGINEISAIVRAMKSFAHPGSEERVFSQVNDLIKDVITLGKAEWRECATVVCELDTDLEMVACMPSSLAQAVLNLVVNAAHAIRSRQKDSPGDGVITIRTRKVTDGVQIAIQDNGCGIPEEIKARIYDPFFTTKPVGEGTGQGLALARTTIEEAHHGAINCESKVGEGTIFTLTLPRSSEMNAIG